MDPLPFIDEHRQPVDAPAEQVWAALLAILSRRMGAGERFARLLGCDPCEGTGRLTGRVGETVPGFRVAAAEPGHRLELRGRHRFADYLLTFVLTDGHLAAETRAAFPGLLGRLYRTAVIGTGAHKLVTRRLLRAVARAASR
jgi:hypothetical protein